MNRVREQSEAIRRARNLTLWLFVAFPIVGVAVIFVVEWLGLTDAIWLFAMTLYVVVLIRISIKWSYATCPMCYQPMFRKPFFFYGFIRCVSCGYNLKDPTTSSNAGLNQQN